MRKCDESIKLFCDKCQTLATEITVSNPDQPQEPVKRPTPSLKFDDSYFLVVWQTEEPTSRLVRGWSNVKQEFEEYAGFGLPGCGNENIWEHATPDGEGGTREDRLIFRYRYETAPDGGTVQAVTITRILDNVVRGELV